MLRKKCNFAGYLSALDIPGLTRKRKGHKVN